MRKQIRFTRDTLPLHRRIARTAPGHYAGRHFNGKPLSIRKEHGLWTVRVYDPTSPVAEDAPKGYVTLARGVRTLREAGRFAH